MTVRSCTVLVDKLEVFARVGVPQAERAHPQRLLISATLHVSAPTNDEVSDTADYAAVSESIRTLCAHGERKLIETLARDCAQTIFDTQPAVQSLSVTIHKFIIPGAASVAVQLDFCR